MPNTPGPAMQINPPVVGQHRVHTFAGTPFEIGRRHGAALKHEIISNFAEVSTLMAARKGITSEALIARVYDSYQPLFRARVPRAVDEIAGLAAGSGLDQRQAFFAATYDGLTNGPQRAGCTAFACGRGVSLDGHVLMGQTKDTREPVTDRYHVMRYHYDDGLRMVLLNYPGWIANIGLTSHGMCFTGNNRYGIAPTGEVAPYSLLKRLVLEKTTTADVLAASNDLVFDNGAFLIGDRGGHIVFLEYLAGHRRTTDVSAKAFGCANCAVHDDLKVFEDRSKKLASSPLRQRCIGERLSKIAGRATPTALKEALADHETYPASICLHGTDASPPQTTAAFVADLSALRIDICIGNPCAAEFLSYQV